MPTYAEIHGGNVPYGSSYDTERDSQSCCGKEWLKTVLLFFNLIIWLTGITLLSVGIYLLFNRESYVSVLSGELFYIGNYFIIVAGSLIFLTATLGCLGIFKNWPRLLSAYAWFLGIIMFLEVAGVLMAYVFSGMLQNFLMSQLRIRMISASYKTEKRVTAAVDHVQTRYRCCGVRSFHDWKETDVWSEEKGLLVPDSCCKSKTSGCGRSLHPSNINTIGCYDFIANQVRTNSLIVGGIGLVIALLELIAIILACCLVRSLKHMKHDEKLVMSSKY